MERAIRHLSTWLKDVGELTEEQEEIVVYSLLWITLSIAGVTGVVLLGWALGVLLPAISAGAAAGALRLVSGGAHYSSIGRCAFMSSATFPVIAWVSARLPETWTDPMACAILIGAAAAIIVYAPVDNEAKPIRTERRPIFRIASLVVLGIIAGIAWSVSDAAVVRAISLAVGWQALSLTPAGHVVYGTLDRMIGGEGVQK